MRLLAFDTTGERLGLALDDGGRVRRRLERGGRDQDEVLQGAVDRLLKAAGLALSDIDAFVAVTGPGRFTGIRVGLTFATVLAKALGKKAVGVSWFEACAWRVFALAGEGELIVAAVPGWKGEFFFQVFRREQDRPRPLHPPRWARPEDLSRELKADLGEAEARFVGPAGPAMLEHARGAAAAGGPLAAVDLLPPAKARLAAADVDELAPLYVKPPHYEKSAPRAT